MNNKSANLDCSFHSGSEDYSFMEPYDNLIVEKNELGKTTISTHVLMTSGCHIEDGFANLDNNTVTLTYRSWDNGTICFEQYSCKINFTILTHALPSDPKYILINDHQSRTPTIGDSTLLV